MDEKRKQAEHSLSPKELTFRHLVDFSWLMDRIVPPPLNQQAKENDRGETEHHDGINFVHLHHLLFGVKFNDCPEPNSNEKSLKKQIRIMCQREIIPIRKKYSCRKILSIKDFFARAKNQFDQMEFGSQPVKL